MQGFLDDVQNNRVDIVMRFLWLLPLLLTLSQCAQPPRKPAPQTSPPPLEAAPPQQSLQTAIQQARQRGDWERFILQSEALWQLSSDADRAAIEVAIWSQLRKLPPESRAHLSESPYLQVRAWVDLVDFMNAKTCCLQQRAQDLKWLYPRAIYWHHLLPALTRAPTAPRHVAVLLPLQGRYAPVAQSIRAGMIKQLYSQRIPQLQLTFHDTSSRERLQKGYAALLSTPADAVIGPLLPENIAWISQRGMLPAWLLNDRINGYGYSLHYTRSNEIDMLVAWLHALGARRIGIFSEQTPSAQRITQELMDTWMQTPSHTAIAANYDLNPRKIRYTFDHLLHIDLSKARKNNLQYTLNHPLAFQPRPRQDLQALVIATRPKIAAVINPLRAFYGLKTPVLGTSLLMHESLHTSAIATRDLKHIPFPGMPVLLNPDPYANRLEAYGADALWLSTHPLPKGTCAQRLTGRLGFDEHGDLTRRLIWLQYSSDGSITRTGDTP
ncbi:Outer membrane lipoprotein LpoA, binds and activates PBP1a [Sulfurivirga caldicuralii]|uniref:Outer membrane lipoprotein LpoA, binds and activates PBP1a n=1 Tax=Sulfurivirga caldicuralii TaxID=364032 RepID=A0A1N6DUZ8_9GAMM|nr:penicillin-binding protein activator [Sulfurivirga caldicuralii]SIN74581.1 Outer membrane lipoprotein LpoA, binds and activates PBP1a [Sulfurivirga caldicuralii]